MRRNPSILLFAAVSSTLLTGCVKKSTHQVTLDELAAARAAHAARHMAEVERLEAELEDTEARRAELERYFEEARAEVHRLELVLQERGAEARQLQNRLRALAAVGRMALTHYLAQSLICTYLFYGHGLGWYGSVERES